MPDSNQAATGTRFSVTRERITGSRWRTLEVVRRGSGRRSKLLQTEHLKAWPVRRWPQVAQNKY
jgi:hypothetical protein